jgi:hypothetical protein
MATEAALSKEQTSDKKKKTVLTQTGLLMEGHVSVGWREILLPEVIAICVPMVN